MAKERKPIRWRKLGGACVILVVLSQVAPLLQGWAGTALPGHERWLRKGVDLLVILPLALCAAVLVLEAYGVEFDWEPWQRAPADADPVTRDRQPRRIRLWTGGLIGLVGIALFLDWLRYTLGIDQRPLGNHLYNAFIGVIGGLGWVGLRYLDRRRNGQGSPAADGA